MKQVTLAVSGTNTASFDLISPGNPGHYLVVTELTGYPISGGLSTPIVVTSGDGTLDDGSETALTFATGDGVNVKQIDEAILGDYASLRVTLHSDSPGAQVHITVRKLQE